MADDLLAAQRSVFVSGLTGIEKLVLLAVLDHWSRKGARPWPGVARLVAWTSFGRRTVLRAIQSLEAKGALVVTRRNGSANAYDLGPVFRGLDQCQRDTGATEPPVPERHGTRATESPPPVPEWHPKEPIEGTQEGTHLVAATASTAPLKLGPPEQKTAAKRKSSAPKRAAPIPVDWQPTDEHRAFAREHGLDLGLEVTAFRGHFDGQPVKSPNGRFATWLANAVKFSRERGGGNGSGQRPRATDHGVDLMARRNRRLAGLNPTTGLPDETPAEGRTPTYADVLREQAITEARSDRRRVEELRRAGRYSEADRYEAEARKRHGAAWGAS